jgi:AcrR family transcriptional regulator
LRSSARWPDQPTGTTKRPEAPGGERRTQAARSQATREALIAAARDLFAERGYAAVGTEEIVRRAGVTRGALYHHFEDKRGLLRAAYEQIESELAAGLMGTVPPGAGPLETLDAGAEMFLDACLEPEVQRIVLLDAPAVLGWEEWREIAARYGLGLIEGILAAAMEAGEVREQPLRPLAHALMGALDELAMLVARSEDTADARAEAGRTVTGLVDALRA